MLTPCTYAADAERILPTVEIESSCTSQLGIVDSANAGTVTQSQLEARTICRASELLEAVPGLIVNQHSGEGKAIFIRFNRARFD